MPLVIVQPTANQRFDIDTTPRMPMIQCRARITGVQPDPTADTVFDWSIEISETVARDSCASARVGNCRLTVDQQNVRGGSWRPAFNDILGGDAVIRASARVGGQQLQMSVNIRIRGQNPPTASVSQRLGGSNSTGDRVGCHESRRRQFGQDGMPLLGQGGDVGIMQPISG